MNKSFAPLRLRVSALNLSYLIAFLLLAFFFGARGLDADSVWGDEFYSIFDSGGAEYGPLTVGEIWGRVAERNPWHAPGFFIVLSGWERLAGSTPFAGRTLALLIGMLALAWTYRLGADTASKRVGLYAVALLSTSSFFLYYFHELRMYTLIALLVVFTIWCYLRILRLHDQPGCWIWIGFFGGALGLLYVHYFAALTLAAIGIYHLLFAPKTRRWRLVVILVGGAGVAFLPWARVLFDALNLAAEAETLQARSLSAGETVSKLALLAGNGAVALLIVTFVVAVNGLFMPIRGRRGHADKARLVPTHDNDDDRDVGTRYIVSVVSKIGWGRVRGRARGYAQLIYFALALVILLLVANAILKVMHEGRLRYLMLLTPSLALLLAIGIERIGYFQRWLSAFLLASWLLTGITATLRGDVIAGLDGSTYTAPLHLIERELTGRAQPGDFLIAYPPDDLPTWRYRVAGDFYLAGLGDGYLMPVVFNDSDAPIDSPEETLQSVGDRARVWLASTPQNQSESVSAFKAGLERDYLYCAIVPTDNRLELSLYARSPVCCVPTPAEAPPLMTFGDGITLTGFDLLPGETLNVTLGWTLSESVPPNTYSVALHLVDEAGELVVQADYGFPVQSFICAPTEIDVSDLAPGEYTVMVGVYAWETGDQLTGRIAATGVESTRLPLETFAISTAS